MSDSEKDLLSPEEVASNLRALIDSLLECEKCGKSCRRCKEKNDCLLFIRNCVAVSLQFILLGLDKQPQKKEVRMYT